MTDPVDPDAPWGINPKTGKPYRRDPSAFDHLRGKPFGTKPSDARAQDQKATGRPPRKREAKEKKPPAKTAAAYQFHIRNGIELAGKGLLSRGNPVPPKAGPRWGDGGVVLVLQADAIAEAWGPMALRYPMLGRTIDRLTDQGEQAKAWSSLSMTFAMMARTMGYVPEGSFMARTIDAMIQAKLQKLMETDPDLVQEIVLIQEASRLQAGDGENATPDQGVPVDAAA